MNPSPQILRQHAVTHNTPLKLRTTSVPTTGKLLKAQDINQDLLVELEGATIDEDPLERNSHYILVQCDQVSPSTSYLPPAPASTPLKIKSLEHQNQAIYHHGHWDAEHIPHILRTMSTSTSSSRSRKSNKTHLRRESICRVIPGTLQEESVEGTFLPIAGAEEESTARWLNKVTEALMALDPSHGPLTRSRAKPARFWSSEASCKPVKDNMMTLKPDLILREKPRPAIIGPQPEFSWSGVISFLELTSSAYQDSVRTGNVRNAIMRKAYALFASQPGRRFLFALSIAKQEFRAHMFDRAGVVHSRGYDIHRSPRVLLRMLSLLAFGHPEHIGYDTTFTYSSPVPRPLLTNSKTDLGLISVRSDVYIIICKIFYGFLIRGRATSCWHVKRKNKHYVIKDSWTHEGRQSREEEILIKIKNVEGVTQLVDAWTVEVNGLQDRTSTRRSSLPSLDNEVRIHRRLVMQPVAIPMTDFVSI